MHAVSNLEHPFLPLAASWVTVSGDVHGGARRIRLDTAIEDAGTDPRVVPTTMTTVAQWVRMCADGALVRGPLNDDAYARRVYGLSGRQLRNVRSAAVSGALARRAAELGVDLPAGYTAVVADRVNGHEFADVAG